MSNGSHEFSGKSVEEAIQLGLNELGLTEDRVEIEILSRGSRGIFGLGSEPARVRITPRALGTPPSTPTPSTPPVAAAPSASPRAQAAPVEATPAAPVTQDSAEDDAGEEEDAELGADDPSRDETIELSDDELVAMASDMLGKLVTLMGFEAEIEASWQDADENGVPYLLLDIRGNDLGSLIGRRGETLSSLQYLLRLMVNQRLRQWKNIVVDVEQYKQRRVSQLTQLAERMARQVVESGRSIALEPMPASERRIIHLTLRDSPDVFTESIGEGERRKVTIAPRRV